MEVYILDGLLRRTVVVDIFESLIWTERWAEIGDFELVLYSNRQNRSLFVRDVKLATNTSYRVMVVETVEDSIGTDGKRMLKVKGRSLEKILEDRIIRWSNSSLTAEPSWNFTPAPPGDIARYMFQRICIEGGLNSKDVIPFFTWGSHYPADTIPDPSYNINWNQEPDTLLNAIKSICDLYEFGFRLTRYFDTSQLFFNVYSGSDRTVLQSILPPVVFSPELDNLENINELSSSDKVKNVAHVVSDQGFVEVYADGVDPTAAGFDRRVLLVKAENLEGSPTSTQITDYLTQRGREELSLLRPWFAFDGEISQSNEYVYDVHYHLGDLVSMMNTDGALNTMRVTEQIFVDDAEGERAYPTLITYETIDPGTWASWQYDKTWSTMSDTEFWNTQP